MKIDHVLICVQDLDAAAERLLERYGLGSVPGGQHLDWGTGNRIVPREGRVHGALRRPRARARQGDPIGRWVTASASAGDSLMALCVATDDIQSVSERLGVPERL